MRNTTNNSNPISFLLKRKKWLAVVVVAVVAVVVVRYQLKSSLALVKQTKNEPAVLGEKLSTDQWFNFMGRDSQGYLTANTVNFGLIEVQKQSEVLVKGKRAQARNGKVFLVFEIAVKNDSSQVLYLDPVDLVRWVESDGELIAPQVSQGNLEIRPQSTKKSNLGFVVPSGQNNFRIQVGELDGEKSVFELQTK